MGKMTDERRGFQTALPNWRRGFWLPLGSVPPRCPSAETGWQWQRPVPLRRQSLGATGSAASLAAPRAEGARRHLQYGVGGFTKAAAPANSSGQYGNETPPCTWSCCTRRTASRTRSLRVVAQMGPCEDLARLAWVRGSGGGRLTTKHMAASLTADDQR